jgi:hypothetical protein
MGGRNYLSDITALASEGDFRKEQRAGPKLAVDNVQPRTSYNQFTGTKPKSRYGRMNRRRHRSGQALYLAGSRPRCAVTRRVW